MSTSRFRTVIALASLLLASAGCNLIPWWHKDQSAPPRKGAPADPSIAVTTTRPATTRVAVRRARPAVEAELRGEITYLASDALQGRGIETPGIDAAAEYVRNKFMAAGLRPLPALDGYFQPFDHTTVAGIASGTSLKLPGGAKAELFKDYTVLSSSAEGEFSGPLAFVGYGIADEKEKYDDFAGTDVKGKVCLVLRFEPQDEQGKSRFAKEGYSVNAHLRTKFNACADHGATAVLLVNPPGQQPGMDVLLPFARAYQEGPSRIPVLQVTQKVAGELLTRAGLPPLSELEKRIDTTGKPNSKDAGNVTVAGSVALDRTTKKLRNVCAYLPGSGALADEYVVVGAHYDHLGWGGAGSLAPGSRAIHHGADDNASGTAALLTLATHMARDPLVVPRPRSSAAVGTRSVLFVAFTAEESGLIGSAQFVKSPPVPLDRIAAMLNMDMVGRMKGDTLYIGGAGTAAPFDSFVKQADDDSVLEFKDFGRGGFGPSDHLSFAARKVPVLFLFTGMHADYHRPTDTADKINYAGLTEVVAVARELVGDLVTMPRSPYLASADAASPHSMGSSGGTGSRVSLGVIPDYGTDISKGGVRITGTSPGSPAEKAGLKEGDVLVGFGSKTLGNLYDLTDALAGAKAGEKVTIRFVRDGKEQSAEATLAERR